MAIIKPNNNTISAITALPASIPTGKVLQVVQDTQLTNSSTTSTSWTDSALSLNITPSTSSNKVLIRATISIRSSGGNTYIGLQRNGSFIGGSVGISGGSTDGFTVFTDNGRKGMIGIEWLDSPSSASAVTYKIQFAADSGETVYISNLDVNVAGGTSSLTAMEIEV